jgi:hypothetical protein
MTRVFLRYTEYKNHYVNVSKDNNETKNRHQFDSNIVIFTNDLGK